jgi:hypothetical protein
MDATLAIMAARPLYCALPEGLMTTNQRVRGVPRRSRATRKTRLFLNDRERNNVFAKLAHDQSKLENQKEGKTG